MSFKIQNVKKNPFFFSISFWSENSKSTMKNPSVDSIEKQFWWGVFSIL